jgi:hypothetical protein
MATVAILSAGYKSPIVRDRSCTFTAGTKPAGRTIVSCNCRSRTFDHVFRSSMFDGRYSYSDADARDGK